MSHIVFVEPASPFLQSDKGAVSLGILHLAAECSARGMVANFWSLTGDQAAADYFAARNFHGLDWFHNNLQWMLEEIGESAEEDVSLFAITATSAQYQSALDLKNIIKCVRPKMPVAIGGPHVSALPNMAIDDGFDLVAVGEADIDFPVHLENYHIKVGEPFILNCKAPRDLDSLQLPARELVDLKSYCANLTVGEGLATTVLWSRGCPYKCAYCQRVMGDAWRIYRVRDPQLCVAELDSIYSQYGINRFVAVDDIMGLQKPWLKEFCDIMKMRNYEWRCNIRVNTLYHDMLENMYQSGCRCISFGMESSDDRILALISKNTVELNEKAIKSCKNAGINVKTYWIWGFPGDDEQSSDALKNFIEKNKPDSAQLATLIPLVSTPLYQQAIEMGFQPDYTKMYHNGRDGTAGDMILPWWNDKTLELRDELVSWIDNFYGTLQPTIQCPVADRG